jgi:LPXTG-site transpeptidase (sortase) family protein
VSEAERTEEVDEGDTGRAGAAAVPAPRAGGGREPRGPVSPLRRRVAAFCVVLGELLITGGVVLVLFAVYGLWWTNILADRSAHHAAAHVRETWLHHPGQPDGPGKLDTKGGIGFLHVPAMSQRDVLVERGTDAKELNRGVAGYYTHPVKSGMPQDQSGNFVLAAHRDGHGAKFHNIDRIRKGDPVVFETQHTWFVYKVFAILPSTSKYNVHVLDAVPKQSGKKKPGRYITLTTCTPVFTSEYRYIVWGELVRTRSVDAKRTPPPELRGH